MMPDDKAARWPTIKLIIIWCIHDGAYYYVVTKTPHRLMAAPGNDR